MIKQGQKIKMIDLINIITKKKINKNFQKVIKKIRIKNTHINQICKITRILTLIINICNLIPQIKKNSRTNMSNKILHKK